MGHNRRFDPTAGKFLCKSVRYSLRPAAAPPSSRRRTSRTSNPATRYQSDRRPLSVVCPISVGVLAFILHDPKNFRKRERAANEGHGPPLFGQTKPNLGISIAVIPKPPDSLHLSLVEATHRHQSDLMCSRQQFLPTYDRCDFGRSRAEGYLVHARQVGRVTADFFITLQNCTPKHRLFGRTIPRRRAVETTRNHQQTATTTCVMGGLERFSIRKSAHLQRGQAMRGLGRCAFRTPRHRSLQTAH